MRPIIFGGGELEDTRPDIREHRTEKGVEFHLKANGDLLTLRACEALFWTTNCGHPFECERVEFQSGYNFTVVRFETDEGSTLFKLFFL